MSEDGVMMSRRLNGEWWVLVSDFRKELKKRDVWIGELEREVKGLRSACGWLEKAAECSPEASGVVFPPETFSFAAGAVAFDPAGTFKEWWERASSGGLGYVSEETAFRIWEAAFRRQEKWKRKGGK